MTVCTGDCHGKSQEFLLTSLGLAKCLGIPISTPYLPATHNFLSVSDATISGFTQCLDTQIEAASVISAYSLLNRRYLHIVLFSADDIGGPLAMSMLKAIPVFGSADIEMPGLQ